MRGENATHWLVRGAIALALTLPVGEAQAQSSSLYGDPQTRGPLAMGDASWTYEPPPEPKQFKLHDQLTVVVSERSIVTSEGEMDRRKKMSADAIIKDWMLLDGLKVFPDPQASGDPKISTSYENKFRSQADLETRDSMSFKIAVSIVDKRPNGLLVVEGVRTIRNNHEVWEQNLSGVVRPEDVLPNNTVLSENVANLRIYKREAGHVRDGYRRGWFLQWLDKYQPF